MVREDRSLRDTIEIKMQSESAGEHQNSALAAVATSTSSLALKARPAPWRHGATLALKFTFRAFQNRIPMRFHGGVIRLRRLDWIERPQQHSLAARFQTNAKSL